MAFLELRSSQRFLNPSDPRRAYCIRRPDRIVYGVAEAVVPNGKPPVRIYIGSEPGQYRPERVLVWSVLEHRDPARVYEIYLMKELAGFDRRGWTTGFTNYRFAIPHYAAAQGRAIYTDEDMAWFADPGELFDADMGEHGFLSTDDTETSLMLIDCERMAAIWPLEDCQKKLKKEILGPSIRAHPGIRGDLDPVWTARDDDFVRGQSKFQHWTTLHTQPWRPLPNRFAYQPNRTGDLWFDLERSADAAGFQVFRADAPSPAYHALFERLREAPPSPNSRRPRAVDDEAARRLERDLQAGGNGSLLELRLGDDPVAALEKRSDGIFCCGLLEYLPDEDAPWVIDRIFAQADRFVCVGAENGDHAIRLEDASELRNSPRDRSWWMEHFETAARRHPHIHWTLVLGEWNLSVEHRLSVREGGRCWTGTPRVWILCDDNEAEAREALALGESLGWSCQRKDLRFRGIGRLETGWLGARCTGLDRAVSSRLERPWPDVVIAAGGRCARVARWIRDQDSGRPRLVQLGRRGGEVAEWFDAMVSPADARLWPHPNRIETSSGRLGTSDPVEGADTIESPLREWVIERANGSPKNRRGTTRPQQGLEYLCARLIERGLLIPPSASRPAASGTTVHDGEQVARRVRHLLGLTPA